MKRKLTALFLVLVMVLALLPASVLHTASADAAPVDQSIVQGGAILHCFDWSFDEIREALPDIAAAGYAAVQTSPVQPPKDYNASWNDTSGNWWKLYQPLDFCVVGENGSWLGSKADLTALCRAAENKGIYVIVDVVANHTANITGGGYTVNGTYNVSPQVAERLQDPDGSKNLYHTSTDGVNDGSRYAMTQYHLSMPDLNTGNRVVQDMVLDFLKECVDCGVDGFRFDAAKHIELPGDSGCGSDFWPYVIGGIRDYAENDLYIYGESLSGSGSDAWVGEYLTYMALTDNQTGNAARGAVCDQNAGALAIGTYSRGDFPKDYVIWAESHDTYEDGGSTGVSSDKIVRTWAIVGARADSTALYLARPNERMGLASSDTSWKSPAVAEVNKFKTHYDGTGEYLSFDQDAKVTWIERGNAGSGAGVVIDKLDGAGTVTLTAHLMSDGYYTDEITGNIFTVSDGTITGNVGPTGVAVVYKTTEETPPAPSEYITANPIYFVPTGWWLNDGAVFTMYLKNNEGAEEFVDLEDGDAYGIYVGEVPEGQWTSVIFARRPGWSAPTDKDSWWNQTADLVPDPGTNCFTITEGTSDGTWSVYDAAAGGYYLVGTMTGWSVLPEYKLTLSNDVAMEYSIDVPLLRTSKPYHSQFKVVYSPDSVTAQTWYPDGFNNNYGDYDGEIPQSGVYTVYFSPDYSGNGLTWHDRCIYAERTKFFVTVSDTDKNGTVTVDKDVAAAGETVTVTVTPNAGYSLESLVYMCETGFNTGEFDITEIDGNTFEMPAENAAVKATFNELPPAPEPKFTTHSLVLSGQIGLNFFMDLPSIEGVDYTKSYMTFDISGKGTCTARDNYDPNYMNGSKTYYGFTCYINSIQMADKITATFHYGDGQTIEETYSVKDYFILFDQNASAFNSKTKNLIQSIADFGHYVQLFLVESGRWTLGTDYAEMDHYYKQSFDLNAIGSAVAKYAVVRDNKTNGDLSGVPSFALMLDSETSIKAFFTPASGYTGSLKVTIDGKNATVKKDGNRFYVQTSGISAHKLGEVHTIVATTDHGTATITVSALSYVDTVLKATTVSAAAKNAVAAIYCYYEAVMAYRAAD